MNRKGTQTRRLEALKKESERAMVEQIRRLLALPMNKRTNFLRVRLPGGGGNRTCSPWSKIHTLQRQWNKAGTSGKSRRTEGGGIVISGNELGVLLP